MKTEENKIETLPVDTAILADLPWMGSYRTTEGGQILTKTALVMGDKIGGYNPFGSVVWLDKNAKVILVTDENRVPRF